MHFILDTNIFPKIFNVSHSDFIHYKNVIKCIDECKGKFVIGGSQFLGEVFSNDTNSPLKKYRKLLLEYQKKGKLKILDKFLVDKEVIRLKLIEPHNDFDDPHLIACSIIGFVNIVCTDDSRSDRYIKDKKFYPRRFPVPSIYRNKNHKHLVQDCCK